MRQISSTPEESSESIIEKNEKTPRLGDLIKQGKIRVGVEIWTDGSSKATKIEGYQIKGNKLIVNKREVWDFGAFVNVR